MNKFLKTLTASNTDIKQLRADMAGSAAQLEVDAKINMLTRTVNNHKSLIANLGDLAPDNKYSLKPGGDFKAINWVEDLFAAKRELKLAQIDLDIMNEIKEEWFTEESDGNK